MFDVTFKETLELIGPKGTLIIVCFAAGAAAATKLFRTTIGKYADDQIENLKLEIALERERCDSHINELKSEIKTERDECERRLQELKTEFKEDREKMENKYDILEKRLLFLQESRLRIATQDKKT